MTATRKEIGVQFRTGRTPGVLQVKETTRGRERMANRLIPDQEVWPEVWTVPLSWRFWRPTGAAGRNDYPLEPTACAETRLEFLARESDWIRMRAAERRCLPAPW